MPEPGRLPCRRCAKPIAAVLHRTGAVEKGLCMACREKAGIVHGVAFQGGGAIDPQFKDAAGPPGGADWPWWW